MYGFKGTNDEFKCRDKKYAIKEVFRHDGEIDVCSSGFHFCDNLMDVYKYYLPYRNNRYFLIKSGENTKKRDSKYVCDTIKFMEEITIDNLEYLLRESKYQEIYRKNVDGIYIYAIHYGNLYKLKYLETYMDSIPAYALCVACVYRYRDIIEYLLMKGLRLNIDDIENLYLNYDTKKSIDVEIFAMIDKYHSKN